MRTWTTANHMLWETSLNGCTPSADRLKTMLWRLLPVSTKPVLRNFSSKRGHDVTSMCPSAFRWCPAAHAPAPQLKPTRNARLRGTSCPMVVPRHELAGVGSCQEAAKLGCQRKLVEKLRHQPDELVPERNARRRGASAPYRARAPAGCIEEPLFVANGTPRRLTRVCLFGSL